MDFTPNQKYSLLSKMGYTGPMDNSQMENFIASNPGAAAKMGKFQKAMVRGFQTGGSVGVPISWGASGKSPPKRGAYEHRHFGEGEYGLVWNPNAIAPKAKPEAKPEVIDFTPTFQAKDYDLSTAENIQKAQQDYTEEMAKLNARLAQTKEDSPERRKILGEIEILRAQDPVNFAREGLQAKAITDPSSLVTEPEAVEMEEAPGTVIDEETGQLTREAGYEATTRDAAIAEEVGDIEGATYDAATAEERVAEAVEGVEAVTSEVGRMATVQGQYEELMKDFEQGTPPWASGAMRAASAQMQARGLGASSIAGAAIVQSAMEAALPIAQQDAATFAQREMENLSNEQQTRILKTQFRFQSILEDQAAENAAKQFNASSENQVNMFREELKSQVSQFNAGQVNAMLQSNQDAKNAAKQFNETLKNQREQFNSEMSLVIAQANAQWRQNIETVNTATQNQINMDSAKIANAITMSNLDSFWQEERDLMAFAFQRTESILDRSLDLLIADKRVQAELQMAAMSKKKSGFGSILGSVLGSWASSGFALPSDRRLKKDIELLETREDGLNVYRFKYDWSNRSRIGFMADEVKKAYPEAVEEGKDGYLMVDYSKVPGGTDLDIYGLETDVREAA